MARQPSMKSVYMHLYAYARYVEAIQVYESRAMHNTHKFDGQEYVRGSYRSDPTARGAMALIDMPQGIRRAYDWVRVVDSAMYKFSCEDAAYGRSKDKGVAYVMRTYFCLGSEARQKSQNEEMRRQLAKQCEVDLRTIYRWLHQITHTVQQYAIDAGLIHDD